MEYLVRRLLFALVAWILLLQTVSLHAATEPLSLMLLPPMGGKGSPQLAISWKGSESGQLELQALDASGQARKLKTRALTPGMHLDALDLETGDRKLLAVLRDARGLELARAEQDALPRVPELGADLAGEVDRVAEAPNKAAPMGQPLGSTLDWKASFAGNDGPNGLVYATTIFDDGSGPALIIGGDFASAGGSAANRVARWNGSAWTALGTGLNGDVYALTVFDGTLIAGGGFTMAGGTAANRIARWNGSAWSALGTGMNNAVIALTVFDGSLIAGGGFTNFAYIARWNGSTWSALGGGDGQCGPRPGRL